LKKSTGAVWFQFYKLKTKKIKPNRTKPKPKKPEKNQAKPKKLSQPEKTELN